MKYVSIFSVDLEVRDYAVLHRLNGDDVSRSAAEHVFRFAGPTATTSPLFLLIATMDRSLTTMPLPRAKTSVFAVPKSIARSDENKLKTERML